MDLKGKIAVVSGATSGIGRAAALKLASQGAEVLAIGRDAQRGQSLEAELKAASGGKGSFLQADLSRIAEAKRVLEQISSRCAHLDAVILSAGGLDFTPVTTSEGLNNTFVVNFLHKFVLGEGLKALLARGKGRLVLVAADIPDKMEPDWANFEGARVYAGVPSLPRLHAACLCLIQHWASAWKAEGIEVMAIHPGVVETEFFRAAKGPWKLLKAVFGFFATTPDAVALQLSTLAFAPELKGNNGEFFPAPKDPKKHRPLQRPAATIERVLKVVQSVLPN